MTCKTCGGNCGQCGVSGGTEAPSMDRLIDSLHGKKAKPRNPILDEIPEAYIREPEEFNEGDKVSNLTPKLPFIMIYSGLIGIGLSITVGVLVLTLWPAAVVTVGFGAMQPEGHVHCDWSGR